MAHSCHIFILLGQLREVKSPIENDHLAPVTPTENDLEIPKHKQNAAQENKQSGIYPQDGKIN